MNGLRERLLLYAVTDRAWLAAAPAGSDTLAHQVEEALLGGATLVQLREKALPDADFIRLARQVKAVTDAHGVPLVINDSLAVALAVDAAGLHIGQEDGDTRLARKRLGPDKILGVSVQNPAQARAAEAAGADYLGVGAVFPTSTKPDAAEVPHEALAAICAAVRLPVVAIGGITRGNAHALAGSGLAGIAVVSALFAQGPRIRAAAQELRALAETICCTEKRVRPSPLPTDTGVPPLENLALRSRALTAIRAFFTQRGFVEVETPVRIPAPALELHIDALPAGAGHWLRTSPELHMKRLLAAGCERIFQLGPCFRAGERGSRHTPEFTLLEWYRAQAGSREILADTEALVRQVARETLGRTTLAYGGAETDLAAPWHVLTVREAFRAWAGWDPVAAYDPDRFDLDLVNRVEPALPRDRPVILTDYPAAAAALARLKPGDAAVAERWELYIGGLEIANAYGELTDPAAQRARFLACADERRVLGKAVYPLDEPFLAALEAGMQPAGGIALGVDRLVMLLCGAETIDAVRPFCPLR